MNQLIRSFETIKKYWYHTELIILLDLTVFLFITLSFGWNIATIVVSSALIVILTAYWYRDTKLPKNKESLGILLAVKNSKDIDADKFENDFIKVLKETISENHQNIKTTLYPLNEYYAAKITTENFIKYLNKTNCNICLFGTLHTGYKGGEKHYRVRINIAFKHRIVTKEVSNEIGKEISQLFPNDIAMSVNNELVNFTVLTEWLRIVVLYCLLIAEIMALKKSSAQSLLNTLTYNLKSTKLQLPAIEKIRGSLDRYQMDIYVIESLILYQEWRNTRDEELLIKVRDIALQALKINQNSTRFIIQLSVSEVVLNQNLNGAIRLLLPIKRQSLAKLNIAFILCLKHSFDRSLDYYLTADFNEISIDQLNQVESFSEWYKNKHQKNELAFILCLINLFGKQDYISAKNDFNDFMKFISTNDVDISDKTLEKVRDKFK